MSEGSAKEAWGAARRVGCICQYLVLQDAPRKRSIDGQYRGPGIGTNVHIIDASIYQTVGEGKWAKTQIIIKNGCKGSHRDNP